MANFTYTDSGTQNVYFSGEYPGYGVTVVTADPGFFAAQVDYEDIVAEPDSAVTAFPAQFGTFVGRGTIVEVVGGAETGFVIPVFPSFVSFAAGAVVKTVYNDEVLAVVTPTVAVFSARSTPRVTIQTAGDTTTIVTVDPLPCGCCGGCPACKPNLVGKSLWVDWSAENVGIYNFSGLYECVYDPDLGVWRNSDIVSIPGIENSYASHSFVIYCDPTFWEGRNWWVLDYGFKAGYGFWGTTTFQQYYSESYGLADMNPTDAGSGFVGTECDPVDISGGPFIITQFYGWPGGYVSSPHQINSIHLYE